MELQVQNMLKAYLGECDSFLEKQNRFRPPIFEQRRTADLQFHCFCELPGIENREGGFLAQEPDEDVGGLVCSAENRCIEERRTATSSGSCARNPPSRFSIPRDGETAVCLVSTVASVLANCHAISWKTCI